MEKFDDYRKLRFPSLLKNGKQEVQKLNNKKFNFKKNIECFEISENRLRKNHEFHIKKMEKFDVIENSDFPNKKFKNKKQEVQLKKRMPQNFIKNIKK